MPLHTDAEGVFGDLSCLNYSIWCRGHDRYATPRFRHSLMVCAVDGEVGPSQDMGQTAAFDQINGVDFSLHRSRRCVGVVQCVWKPRRDVLHEGAAQGNVEHLMAPADRQEWLAKQQPGSQQTEFGVVAFLVYASGPGLEFLSVVVGCYILSATEQQSVQMCQDTRPIVALCQWGDNERGAADLLNRTRIGYANRMHRGMEQPGGGILPPGNADQWSDPRRQCRLLVAPFLQACGATTEVAQVVQLGAADLGVAQYINLFHARRIQQERALNANTV